MWNPFICHRECIVSLSSAQTLPVLGVKHWEPSILRNDCYHTQFWLKICYLFIQSVSVIIEYLFLYVHCHYLVNNLWNSVTEHQANVASTGILYSLEKYTRNKIVKWPWGIKADYWCYSIQKCRSFKAWRVGRLKAILLQIHWMTCLLPNSTELKNSSLFSSVSS